MPCRPQRRRRDRPRPSRWIWIGAIALVPALSTLVACSHARAALPDAGTLLQGAAQAMADVTTTTFSLDVGGNAAGLPISAASGSIGRGGLAEGSLQLGGTTYPFRLVAGTFYLQNPDNSWVSSPPAYDPSTLLDATKGFAGLLAGAHDGRTLGRESVGGVSADKVQAIVPNDIINELSDLAPGQTTLAATLWIDADTNRLVKFRIPFRAPNTDGPTIVTVTLKDFNRPLQVVAPKTS